MLLPRDERGRELAALVLEDPELTRWWRLYEARRDRGAWLELAEAVIVYAVEEILGRNY